MILQERVVTTARGWLGTRFHHQGRIKKTARHKGGVDCLGLLVGVADELGLVSRTGVPLAKYDERQYSHYPDTQRLKSILSMLLYPVGVLSIKPADIVLFSIEGNPQHLGIATGSGIIHAYAPARAVVEHALDSQWQRSIQSVYRLTPA